MWQVTLVFTSRSSATTAMPLSIACFTIGVSASAVSGATIRTLMSWVSRLSISETCLPESLLPSVMMSSTSG